MAGQGYIHATRRVGRGLSHLGKRISALRAAAGSDCYRLARNLKRLAARGKRFGFVPGKLIPMKLINRALLKRGCLMALLTAGIVQEAGAFNYTNSDVLLVFRKIGYNDVEFNLGSVSNFLGRANGTVLTVTNWNLSLTKSTYLNSLSGVSYILLAATSTTGEQAPNRLWATDADLAPATPPTDLPGSRWNSLRGKISYVGEQASALTSSNATQSLVVSSGDANSYTAIASDNGNSDPANIMGLSPFPVEALVTNTLLFYQLKPSSATPKPAASLIGYFYLDFNGVLTFTAGPLQQTVPLVSSHITRITHTTGLATIYFSTTNSLNYRLWYLNQLGAPWSWSSNATLISGDGTVKNFTDNYGGNLRFYRIETLH